MFKLIVEFSIKYLKNFVETFMLPSTSFNADSLYNYTHIGIGEWLNVPNKVVQSNEWNRGRMMMLLLS